LDGFLQWIGNHWLEIFGTACLLLYIFLEIKQQSSLWVVGFISATVYVVVFFRSGLYASSALNVYYMAASVYGMYCWRFAPNADNGKRPVSRLGFSSGIVLVLIFAVLYASVGHVLDNYTDSPVPYGDALAMALSFVATWMLARKILEHWILWIFINFFSSGLYFWCELYPTAGLFVIYGVMSVVGWFKWKKPINHS
jgi:nicotinamide mononucleotide transporter